MKVRQLHLISYLTTYHFDCSEHFVVMDPWNTTVAIAKKRQLLTRFIFASVDNIVGLSFIQRLH